jgi:hypothetical protein
MLGVLNYCTRTLSVNRSKYFWRTADSHRTLSVSVTTQEETVYTVIVGNIGTIGTFKSLTAARASFDEYVKMSVDGYGRAAGESVTLIRGEELIQEHEGTQQCQ